jgi:capsular polysaccharide biosynthesis protein
MLVAVCLGCLLGLGTALVLELMQRRVRSVEDLAETLGVPVLALIGSAAV